MKPRVLFVEDEPSISGPFSSALTREGFEPVVAGSLAEARAAWRAGFDLVLLDLMLPDGDGRDLARELRAPASEVPIIMLTARGTSSNGSSGSSWAPTTTWSSRSAAPR